MSDGEESDLEKLQRELLLAFQRIAVLESQIGAARTSITYASASMTSTRLLVAGLIAELDAVSAGKPNRIAVLQPLELALRAALITITDFEIRIAGEADNQGCSVAQLPKDPPATLH